MKQIQTIQAILKGIQSINNHIPFIEYGGCGTFSYYLHNHLKDKYNIDSEIVYLIGPEAAIQYDIHFSHILVKIDGIVIDNNGCYDYNDNYKKLNQSKLEEMLSIKELWNSKFNEGWYCNYTFNYINPKDKLKELIFKL